MNDHPMRLKGIPVARGRQRLQDAGFSFIFFADDETTEYLAVQFERALAIA
jgi:hypothetical protein